MNRPLSIAFLAVGIVLVILGASASDSVGSSFSRLFTGAPTDRTVWLLVAGVILAAIGLTGSLRGPKSNL